MHWKAKPRKPARYAGEMRVRLVFVLFPRKIEGWWYWLEKVAKVEVRRRTKLGTEYWAFLTFEPLGKEATCAG